MKKVMILTLSLFVALFSVSCIDSSSAEDTLAKGIQGEWHLSSWSGEMSEQIDIYVEFKADNTFNLYQKDWNTPIYYVHYTGTYLIADGVITGKYSDGKNWGATNGYNVSLSKDNGQLTLIDVDNSDDISLFVPVTIPENVKGGAAVMTTRGDEMFNIERFL